MATTDDRIAALEVMVAELRAQLAKPPRLESMSKTLTCPACGGGHILGVKQVNDSNGMGLVPLALGTKSKWTGPEIGDPLQAYVCVACRLVEWHVASLEHLKPDGNTILEFVRPTEVVPESGPYR